MKSNPFSCAWLCVLALAGCHSDASSPAKSAAQRPLPLPEFVFGSAATDIGQAAMVTCAQIGYRWIRVPIRWQMLEPTVTALPTLTRAQLAANPALVDELTARADWSVPDATLAAASKLGLHVIGFVGASSPPTLDGAPLDPAKLGTESYIAEQALATRAIVRRYGRARVGTPADVATIEVWQTENELNIAPAASLIGWRTPAGLAAFTSSPWADFQFQTALLTGLRDAVLAEDADAVTEININTDMNDAFNTQFGRPGWEDVVVAWRDLADVIGFDTYPNYYVAQPADGTIVGQRAKRFLQLVHPGQQVMVVETGYPNGPAARGFSAASQQQFLQQAWTSCRDAGVSGFMPFAIADGSGPDPVFTPDDQTRLDALGAALQDGDFVALAALYTNESDWMQNRMAALTGAVEARWGLYGPNGEGLPALAVVQGIAAETAGR